MYKSWDLYYMNRKEIQADLRKYKESKYSLVNTHMQANMHNVHLALSGWIALQQWRLLWEMQKSKPKLGKKSKFWEEKKKATASCL